MTKNVSASATDAVSVAGGIRLYQGANEGGKVNLLLVAARCIANGATDEGMALVCAMVDKHRATHGHELIDLLLEQQQLAPEALRILDDHGERIVAAYAGSVS